VRGALPKLQGALTEAEVCWIAAKETRRLTGFDRVMVYRFGDLKTDREQQHKSRWGSRRGSTYIQLLLFRFRGFSSVQNLSNDSR
jgi:hypothetical protein